MLKNRLIEVYCRNMKATIQSWRNSSNAFALSDVWKG